ncbi:nucleoside deaminase [Allobaculum sp. Allo2]|uniref:nucleoside deaminase n=1 Tax=Allobaculum sp. Allo2 TaxID=2853432 RepID=UPI003462A40D
MMKKALRLARKAETENEVPVGAIVVDENGTIIGRGYNRREKRQSVTEHAELMAIASACRKLHSWRLENCSLYVTLEPCVMCSGAIIQSRIAHVYYGAKDPKAGAVDSVVSSLKSLSGITIPNGPGYSGRRMFDDPQEFLSQTKRGKEETEGSGQTKCTAF